jgi:hypothetical protein
LQVCSSEETLPVKSSPGQLVVDYDSMALNIDIQPVKPADNLQQATILKFQEQRIQPTRLTYGQLDGCRLCTGFTVWMQPLLSFGQQHVGTAPQIVRSLASQQIEQLWTEFVENRTTYLSSSKWFHLRGEASRPLSDEPLQHRFEHQVVEAADLLTPQLEL